MGLYDRFCKRFFAAVIIRLTGRRIITAAKKRLQNLSYKPISAPSQANNHSGKKTLTEPIIQTYFCTQNQPTRYYDQAPAMNWDLAVSWGRGVWVSVSDIGRVGQPELEQSPQATRGKTTLCCAVN